MIAKSADEVLEKQEHIFNLAPVRTNGYDFSCWQMEVRTHQDVTTLTIPNTNKTNPSIDGLPEQVQAIVFNGFCLTINRQFDRFKELGELEIVNQFNIVILMKLAV